MEAKLLVVLSIVAVIQLINVCQADPCANVQCSGNEVCRLQEVQCFTTPCLPQPVCDASVVDETKCGPGAGPVLDITLTEISCNTNGQCPDHTECKPSSVCCWKGPGNISKPGSKPGKCPKSKSGFGICIARCSNDFDCPGKQKCCGNCPLECAEPVFKPKPGRCPVQFRRQRFNPQRCLSRVTCNTDSDCKGIMKCCNSRCGKTCRWPRWWILERN